jgi:hypothetical protein
MKKLALPLAVLLVVALAVPVSAAWLTDPLASPSLDGTTLVLHKELSGYNNYGADDGKADVLYTRESGTWTFSSVGLPPGTAVQFVISGVLDDHYSVAKSNYSMTVHVNGTEVFSGEPGFVHGEPYGKVFTNWEELSVDANGEWSITIANTSTGIASTDWIAFDWIELRVALTEPAASPPCWDVTGQWDQEAYLGTSTYDHLLSVLEQAAGTGILTGHGQGMPSGPSYDLFGTVDGCNVSLLRVDNPETRGSYWAVIEGSIDAAGQEMSGTWYDSNGKNGTWVATGQAAPLPDAVEWLPPISLDDWVLNENATLPVKFHRKDCYGDILTVDLGPALEVTYPDGSVYLQDLRFDPDEYYYIANFRPTMAGYHTAVVSFDDIAFGSRDFEVVEPGKANGRGKGLDK